MTEETSRSLAIAHAWANRHATRSAHPSRFIDCFEGAMGTVRADGADPDSLIDYRDPVRLAAEIEARAAWRRVLIGT